MTKIYLHNRWQSFVIGLLVGIIAGSTVVWFEMKDANRNFFSQILFELNTLKLEKKIQLDEVKKEKEKQERHKKQPTKNQKPQNDNENNIVIADSAQKISEDSTFISLHTSDSVFNDSSESAIVADTSEYIVVKKDKLLFSKTVKLKIKNEIASNAAKKDSLISEISGMAKEEEKSDFSLEFWESPINYKGYKMANKKIILFGIDDPIYIGFESASLFQLDKKIYLKINDEVYQLDETYTFEPYKKITDKTLLAKIEK